MSERPESGPADLDQPVPPPARQEEVDPGLVEMPAEAHAAVARLLEFLYRVNKASRGPG